MKIEIVDVGPRDGLQNESVHLSPVVRADLCDLLAGAGIPRIEAASFVNPRLVPQMAGAEEVLQQIQREPEITYAGLVLNQKGYERAVETGADEVRYAFPVTDTFAKKNQNATVEEATGLAARIVERARLDGVRVSITLAAAFGCPFEGPVGPETVVGIAERVATSAPDEIVLADTIGVGGTNAGTNTSRGRWKDRHHYRLPLPRHPQHRHRKRGRRCRKRSHRAGRFCWGDRRMSLCPPGHRQYLDGRSRLRATRHGIRDGHRPGETYRGGRMAFRSARQRTSGTSVQSR